MQNLKIYFFGGGVRVKVAEGTGGEGMKRETTGEFDCDIAKFQLPTFDRHADLRSH